MLEQIGSPCARDSPLINLETPPTVGTPLQRMQEVLLEGEYKMPPVKRLYCCL